MHNSITGENNEKTNDECDIHKSSCLLQRGLQFKQRFTTVVLSSLRKVMMSSAMLEVMLPNSGKI